MLNCIGIPLTFPLPSTQAAVIIRRPYATLENAATRILGSVLYTGSFDFLRHSVIERLLSNHPSIAKINERFIDGVITIPCVSDNAGVKLLASLEMSEDFLMLIS